MAQQPPAPQINWNDLPDIDFTGLPDDTPQRSTLSSIWDTISRPLTEAPSRFASSIANYLDPPVTGPEDYSPIRSFGAGAIQGVGDLVSGLTSPINLGTTALTGGSSLAAKAGLPAIARMAGYGAKGAGALTAGHGASTVLDPDTGLAEKGLGLTEIAGGVLGMRTPTNIKLGGSATPEGPQIKPTPALSTEPVAPIKPSESIAATAETPKPITYVIKQEKASPDLVKQAMSQGYEFVGLNDMGDFRFRKAQTPVELPILESEVGIQRATPNAVREQLGPLADVKQTNPLVEAYNLPRGMMAAIDFSAPLRQGLPLLHKAGFREALGPMFKSWASEEGFQASQKAISDKPLFKKRVVQTAKGETRELPSFAEEAGLKLTDLVSDLSKREEALVSTWAEKVPGVRRSNRAYTAFLNNLRANVFEELVRDGKVFGADAQTNVPLARALADFVNTASGRGSLGKLEPSATVLNQVLFAPRLIASRVKMLNPVYYAMAPPQVRKEGLKSLLAIAAAGNTVGQLAKMGGAEVSMDPSSSDFGKIKIGNTRVDPWGGFQQYIVAANRLLNPMGPATGFKGETPFTRGQMVTSSTSGKEFDLWNPQRPFDPVHSDVIERFGRGKLHPVLGFAYSLMKGQKELSGEPMNFGTPNPFENAVSQRFIPILIQDLYELAKDDQLPPEVKVLIGTLSAFGTGQQTYGPKE